MLFRILLTFYGKMKIPILLKHKCTRAKQDKQHWCQLTNVTAVIKPLPVSENRIIIFIVLSRRSFTSSGQV